MQAWARFEGEEEITQLADPSALGPLYDRHAKRVFGLAQAMLGSREEAEDLTHDVFETVCRTSAYDPDRGSLRAFLSTLTRSRAIDRLRRRGRSARLLETRHEVAVSAPAPTMPFDHVAMRRATERVRAAVAELPAVHRQVIEMSYYGGLSQQQIAAELDTPLGTVKSWSRRALLALRRALEDFAA